MGQVSAQGLQKILHLNVKYDFFPAWEETLEFEVDGVCVKAIARHQWRGDTVRIVAPFEVLGNDYRQSCWPPMLALGAVMIARQKRLAAEGLSVSDDCIRMARNTYRLHATYLRLKPEIDSAQEAFAGVFRDELAALNQALVNAKDSLRIAKQGWRQQLHAQQLSNQQYANLLKPLQEVVKRCESKLWNLQWDVARELRAIKALTIHRALQGKIEDTAPLRLTGC